MIGGLAFCAAWRIDGGRWVHVETPSMGEVAPVGSLLWVKPVDFDTLQPGDLITFHPPGTHGLTYSHHVLTRNDDGSLTTKGVIPGPDPWRITAAEVVGKVQMNWWGAGWLVVTGPLLIVGFLIIGALRTLARGRWKLPVTLVLGSLVLSIAIVVYQPLINAEQLAFAPAPTGGADASYVGTGLLPIRLQAHEGQSVVLRDGQVGTVHVSQADAQGRLQVRLSPAIPWWFWAGLVLLCFVPALYSLLVGSPVPADEAEAEPE
jgi:hypothetical protein